MSLITRSEDGLYGIVIYLILVDPNPALCEAFKHYFANLPGVTVFCGMFEGLEDYDCLVSAANSFGIMDGGIDLSIIQYFGSQLERRVQKHILSHYLGEQPVGTCFIIETGHSKHPFLAHAPTMRIPMDISRMDNAYCAMWAVLLSVRQYNLTHEAKIEKVACPGLGTGTGRMPYPEAAYQMSLAYKNFLNPPSHLNWNQAHKRQEQIRYGGDWSHRLPPKTHFNPINEDNG